MIFVCLLIEMQLVNTLFSVTKINNFHFPSKYALFTFQINNLFRISKIVPFHSFINNERTRRPLTLIK